jgi:hypothetical protein
MEQVIKSLIDKQGTPFYLFDEKGFVDNYRTLESTFKKVYPKYQICYSYKTNYTPFVCNLVKNLGGLAEVVSDMEYTLAKRLGYANPQIVYNGPSKGDAMYEHLLHGGILNIDSLDEAKRIVSGTLDRLRIWARGYLTLVAVDSTVYTIVLWLLDVPYFPILGLLSGCALLLPYVGPILAASTTVLVTLAVGGASGVQILAIVVAYLIYNGIIEQFILYPVVIGESIGLTTLETIIVVILGAIFAGIPGMILAMPTASVLKYLVPQLYRCWQTRRQS